MDHRHQKKDALNLKQRHRFEGRFRFLGFAATMVAVIILVLLLFYIFSLGLTVFKNTHIFVPIETQQTSQSAWQKELVKLSGLRSRTEQKQFLALFTRDLVNYTETGSHNETAGVWVLASGLSDSWTKGHYEVNVDEAQRPIKDLQIRFLEEWQEKGFIKQQFANIFFQNADSRYPELVGIASALKGTLMTLFITLILSFPVGVLAAFYLEEFARPGPLTRFIELNINNLTAVPSIVFGLLGLSVLLNGFALPRSAPIVGGIVLAMMVMPVIIIATRAAIQAVPFSLREAAFGMGASHMQTIMHFVLPQSVPGIMTGSLIGMARALGETAPLLMIGMVSFISTIPESFSSPATVLSVQVFLWADSPERGFVEKTSGAIIVLLFFLILMNLSSQIIRYRFEKKR